VKKCPLLERIDVLTQKLDSEEERQLVLALLTVAEHALAHIEMGYGSYQLMRAVVQLYEPEKLSLEKWTK